MLLADLMHGRDNNFNLLRIIAASAVLVTHSFALSAGTGDAEPLRASLGLTMGAMAVDAFFVTSGFLVTASLLGRSGVLEYAWARVLRIFPALLVMLLLTVLVLGPVFTTQPLAAYFGSGTIYKYLLKCGTLVFGVAYALPGVFEANPYQAAVNGSLWSMPYEIRMYILLALAWIVTRALRRSEPKRAYGVVLGLAALGSLALVLAWRPGEGAFLKLFYMFAAGAAMHAFRRRIVMSHGAFGACLVALLAGALLGPTAFYYAYVLTVPYVLMYLVYVPAGFVRRYNRLGDYSYGVYIYAFPIQQTLLASFPGLGPGALIGLSGALTLACAWASWHLIEHRALEAKPIAVQRTRGWLARAG
ncbi:MAG TPA: acyltransferase [Ideonella sp.]|jgi:peptidoglycan/LPS O-acetylase OafA/YrhL|nr:acyltransferase [Ideonella sp.]